MRQSKAIGRLGSSRGIQHVVVQVAAPDRLSGATRLHSQVQVDHLKKAEIQDLLPSLRRIRVGFQGSSASNATCCYLEASCVDLAGHIFGTQKVDLGQHPRDGFRRCHNQLIYTVHTHGQPSSKVRCQSSGFRRVQEIIPECPTFGSIRGPPADASFSKSTPKPSPASNDWCPAQAPDRSSL